MQIERIIFFDSEWWSEKGKKKNPAPTWLVRGKRNRQQLLMVAVISST